MSKLKKPASNIVWFEIPADNPDRARKFWSTMFGWKINPMPHMPEYWHLDTGGRDDSPDGGMMRRMHERQPITNYFNVDSIARAIKKVEKLGGMVCKGKTAVPQMGWLAICRDTEGNEFALWEMDENAK